MNKLEFKDLNIGDQFIIAKIKLNDEGNDSHIFRDLFEKTIDKGESDEKEIQGRAKIIGLGQEGENFPIKNNVEVLRLKKRIEGEKYS